MVKKILIVCLMLLIPVASVFSGSGKEQEAAGTKGTLYYLATDMVNGFNIGSAENAEKFGTELGYEVKVLDAKNSPDTQINQVETAMTMNPDAIMIKAVDNQTIVESVKKAREKGIKVIAYDNTITGTKTDFASVLGTVRVGELAGTECVKMLEQKYGSPKGKILQVMGDLGDMYSVLIGEGFKNIMSKNPDIEVITKDSPGWEGQANTVADQLVANKDIDIIFVHADSMIPSVIPVLEAKGYNPGDIKLIGTDGDPSALEKIREGWIQVTIGVPMIQQVWGMYEFLDQILAGESLKPGKYDVKGVQADLVIEDWGPTLYLPGNIITSENVDDKGLWGNIK
jgi:ribose transport system substrate-binding protein